MFNLPTSQPDLKPRAPVTPSDLDTILSCRLLLAYFGEGGYEPRLSFWRTDLCSEFGGIDLFRRLLPSTWEWAVLEGALEAARLVDLKLRSAFHNPDLLLSPFHLGIDTDRAASERLREHKLSGTSPQGALPALAPFIGAPFSQQAALSWIQSFDPTPWEISPTGRRLLSAPPKSSVTQIKHLIAALNPLPNTYPLPHYLRPEKP